MGRVVGTQVLQLPQLGSSATCWVLDQLGGIWQPETPAGLAKGGSAFENLKVPSQVTILGTCDLSFSRFASYTP